MSEFWVTAGLSALIAILISAVVSIWGVSRNIKHKSVIEARQKWRDSLRELVPELVSHDNQQSRRTVRNSIVLHLNPYKDQEAVRLIDDFVSDPSQSDGTEIVAHFQDMLKRDWERAKIEASFAPWLASARSKRVVDNLRRTAAAGDVRAEQQRA